MAVRESLDRSKGENGTEVNRTGESADRNLAYGGRQAQDAGGSQTLWGWTGSGFLTRAGQ